MIICTRSLFVWTSFCVVFNRFLWIGFCAVLLCCILFCFVFIMIEMPAKVNKAKPKGIQKHAATINREWTELHQPSQTTEMLSKQAIKPHGWYICYVMQKHKQFYRAHASKRIENICFWRETSIKTVQKMFSTNVYNHCWQRKAWFPFVGTC